MVLAPLLSPASPVMPPNFFAKESPFSIESAEYVVLVNQPPSTSLGPSNVIDALSVYATPNWLPPYPMPADSGS